LAEPAPAEDWVWLNLLDEVGPVLGRALLKHFGSAEKIRAASIGRLQDVPGIGPQRARAIADSRDMTDMAGEMELVRAHDVQLVGFDDPAYPPLLGKIYDPPLVLYVRGRFEPSDALAVAMVGTRRSSHYGRRQAERLAVGLAAAGATVISGLARGVDAAAHRGALKAGGRTIAVLANGLASVYPPEHTELADEIAACGAVVSETSMRRGIDDRGQFPQRNRVISGLSLGTVVVEAPQRSGALVTARLAGEQGREVFAVPGGIDRMTARGCHQLLRDGAKLVESVADILEELGPLVDGVRPVVDGRTVAHPAELTLKPREKKVLDLLEPDGTDVEDLVATAGLPASQVLSTLTVLEMRRLALRLPDGRFARAMP